MSIKGRVGKVKVPVPAKKGRVSCQKRRATCNVGDGRQKGGEGSSRMRRRICERASQSQSLTKSK